jgi:putative nucleotidyltransferase with HDIG domain
VDLGLSEEEKEMIQHAALLHDIGKIGIPEQILNKPGKLTPEEYEIMKRHVTYGVQIIQQVKFLEPMVPIVAGDHERWDGKGYPRGLKEEQIPLGARIVAVVDAYDAMTEDRVYRKAPGQEFAMAELKRCAGTQFDPNIVKVFLDILQKKEKRRTARIL